MHFDPEKHHRRSIRLKGYDYSQAGLYFVTICVTDMACLFGTLKEGKMVLSEAGNMVVKWYFELPNKFPDIQIGEYIVMPNHFHAIIINNGKGNPTKAAIPGANHRDPADPVNPMDYSVRADLCVRPADANAYDNIIILNGGVLGEHVVPNGDILGEHTGSPLHGIVQWFKTMSTNEYIRGVKDHDLPRFRGKLWQRNYYEHIIRDQRSFENISGYIANNPSNWEADKFYRNQ